jgi:hypothetical protein
MRDEERVRWDVTIPNAGGSRTGDRLKTVVSALVLLVLLAGPVLIREKGGGSEAGRPAGGGLQAAAGGAGGGATAEVVATHAATDSAGTRYERYFPGRQAM